MKKTVKQEELFEQETFFGDPGNMLMIAYVAAVVFFLLLGTLSQVSAQTMAEKKAVPAGERSFAEVKSGPLFITGKNVHVAASVSAKSGRSRLTEEPQAHIRVSGQP